MELLLRRGPAGPVGGPPFDGPKKSDVKWRGFSFFEGEDFLSCGRSPAELMVIHLSAFCLIRPLLSSAVKFETFLGRVAS